MKKPLNKQVIKLIADRFKLLASPTRLEILQHLCKSEKSVTELVQLTGFKQANVSRNLSMLDRAGIVRRRSEGTHVHYSLAEKSLPSICQIIQEDIRASQGKVMSCL